MAYATLAQLAAFMGVAEGDLPANAAVLLDRASDLIDTASRMRAAGASTGPAAALITNAAAAQAEYWIRNPQADDVDVSGGVTSYRAGSVAVTRDSGSVGAGSTLASRLAPRARDYLFRAGVLYAGVG